MIKAIPQINWIELLVGGCSGTIQRTPFPHFSNPAAFRCLADGGSLFHYDGHRRIGRGNPD
jgi:hypothetical protein